MKEIKGDITFSRDSKGQPIQTIGTNQPFKIKNGSLGYITLNTFKGVSLKYNTNGVHGFSLWKNGRCIEDNVWTLETANEIRRTLK